MYILYIVEYSGIIIWNKQEIVLVRVHKLEYINFTCVFIFIITTGWCIN